jgi:DNA-directed RNA polymerase subunit H (RpoH/RPB5)
MSFEHIDALFRSRKTLLNLLAKQGYDTKPFERFSPREIEMMSSNKGALDFVAETEGEEKRFCRVVYGAPRFNKTKMDEFIADRELSEEELAASEFIVMLTDPIVDAHHASALQHWLKTKVRVRYFNIYQLTYSPLDWEGTGARIEYEVVPQEKHTDLMKAIYCTSKAQLPQIRYHADHSGRCLGLVPGDIVKVTRSSPNIGEDIVYRVCVP